ncbi:MAG: NUDIX domain-containing protein, partial [Candidatus Buchananbacteria bacterium]
KEAEEELGLVNFNYTKGDKIRVSTKYQYFAQWFLAVVDKPIEDFKIQKEEVEQIRWFSREELENDLEKNPDKYLKGIGGCLEMFK